MCLPLGQETANPTTAIVSGQNMDGPAGAAIGRPGDRRSSRSHTRGKFGRAALFDEPLRVVARLRLWEQPDREDNERHKQDRHPSHAGSRIAAADECFGDLPDAREAMAAVVPRVEGFVTVGEGGEVAAEARPGGRSGRGAPAREGAAGVDVGDSFARESGRSWSRS
jgi:hypothetical protein